MSYHNLNTLTIFPEHLSHNLTFLSHIQPGVQAVPVVKSNAYGHGIKILAPILQSYDVPFVCVDSLYEAYELKKYGYKKDILIMGYVHPRDIPRYKNFIYAVSDLEYATALIGAYSRLRIHLFLDTGMHREGIQSIDSAYARSIISKICPHIEGVMSHLSTPDDIDVSNNQLATFEIFQKILYEQGIRPRYIHICASGALIYSNQYSFSLGNIARTGLAYYGHGHDELRSALRCVTTLIQVKTIHKGEKIGYDGTYCAENTMKIGVLPIGYNDGVDRRLSNIGKVMLNGHVCTIIGRVSMNITTIDISHIPEAAVGDKVVFIDEEFSSPVNLLRQAESAQTIPYDMLVHLHPTMFRRMSDQNIYNI